MKKISFLLLALAIVSFTFAQSANKKSKLIAKGASLQKIASEYSFTEGPAVAPNGDVYFTD